MEISADEIDDLLYWTLQQSWPVEQHLVAFASGQIGFVNNEGHCGVRYPGSDICSGLLPGQVAVHHWRQGEFLAVSEVAYLNAMTQFLQSRRREIVVKALLLIRYPLRSLVAVSACCWICLVLPVFLCWYRV